MSLIPLQGEGTRRRPKGVVPNLRTRRRRKIGNSQGVPRHHDEILEDKAPVGGPGLAVARK